MMQSDLFGTPMHRHATFSADGTCRLTLVRRWGSGPRACMIGCNPSRAGTDRDDPTCLWWTNWGQALGYGGFIAVNLYPRISSSPDECRKWANWEANGPDWHARDAIMANLDVVVRVAKSADIVIACWGAIAWDDDWIDHVAEHIQTGAAPWPDIHCFGVTQSGAPMHPMARGKHRLPPDVSLKLWRAA